MRRLDEREIFYWKNAIHKPHTRFVMMLGNCVTYPEDYDDLECCFWLSPFLPWRIKILYAAIRYGIKGNQEGNVIRIPRGYAEAAAGVGGSFSSIYKLLKFCHDHKIMHSQGEHGILLVTLRDMDKLPKLLLAPKELLDIVHAAVQPDGQGRVSADGMECLWSMMSERMRPLDQAGYDKCVRELRLKFARAGHIIGAQTEGDNTDGDDDGGNVEAITTT